MDSDKILFKIFSNLNCKTLYSLRCVCKSWNREACLILQSRTLIEFHHVTDISKYISIFGSNEQNPEQPEDADVVPIPHNRYHFFKIRLNLIKDNYLIRTFFKKFPTATQIEMDFTGPQFRLKYLRLCVLEHMANVKSVIFTFKDFYEIWPNSLNDDVDYPIKGVESVESLTIYGFGREAPLKSAVFKILPYFPNISRIEAGEQIGRVIFEVVYGTSDWDLNKDDDSDCCEKMSPTLDKLCHIHFSNLYPIQLEIISNRLSLKSLTGSLHMCTEQELVMCLKSLSPTLKNLVLESSEDFPFFSEVKMTALVNLELTKFNLNLKSLNNFPALTKLKLNKVQIICPDYEDVIEADTNQKFKTLILEFCEISPKMFEILGKLFPRMKKLYLPFCNFEKNIIIEICNNLKTLSQLHLSVGWNNLDEVERTELQKEVILTEFLGDFEGLKIWDENEILDYEFVRKVEVVDTESGVSMGWVIVK